MDVTVTHFDLLVVIAVCFAIGLTAFACIAWMAFQIYRLSKRGERGMRALAGLVVQETEKIRELMAD